MFPEGVAHKQEHAWAIVECKSAKVSRNDKLEGVDQLKSYLAASVGAEFGMWTRAGPSLFRKTVGREALTSLSRSTTFP